MSLITLDFETFYRSKTNVGTPGPSYSLRSMTYEEYIWDEQFQPHGCAIKIDANPTYWVDGPELEAHLQSLFPPGNPHLLVCHNTMFDAAILSWRYDVRPALYICTQAMSRALWNHASSSLDALAKRLFPNDKSKRKGTELEEVDGVRELSAEQREKLSRYACNDVDLTFDCLRAMWAFFPENEIPVMSMILRMFAEPAFHADETRLLAYQQHLTDEKQTLISTMENVEGLPPGSGAKLLASNDKFAAYLEMKYGIIIPKKHSPTPKNPNNYTWALAKDDLEFLALRRDRADLEHLWKARIRVKSTTEDTRIVRLLDHSRLNKGLLAVPLNYSAAHTHRLGGTNKSNFQNFKRGSEIRKSLIAPPGYKIVVVDSSNIEARKLAWVAQETILLDAYRDNRDVYSEFASQVFDRPIDRKRKIIHPVTGLEFKPDEGEGNVGKVAVLGLGFGMGGPTFQTTLAKGPMGMPPMHFPLAFCEKTVRTYRTQYPRIPQFWKACERVIFNMACKDLEPYEWGCMRVERNRIRLPNGLYLNYPGLRKEDHPESNQFEYWNGKFWKSLYGGILTENIVQALARILMTDMMLAIDAAIKPMGGRVILTVHDEIVFLIPAELAEEAYQIAVEIMTRPSPWCDDGSLTLAAEGGIDDCYSK